MRASPSGALITLQMTNGVASPIPTPRTDDACSLPSIQESVLEAKMKSEIADNTKACSKER